MGILSSIFGKKAAYPGVSYKKKEVNNGNTYEVYTGPSRTVALEFLRQTPVKIERHYIICETPQGNIGKDMIMIFDEASGERIEYGERKSLPELRKSKTLCARCGYPVLPAGPTPAGSTDLVLLDEMKEKGVGCKCSSCSTAWCPFCVDKHKPDVCAICGSKMTLFRE